MRLKTCSHSRNSSFNVDGNSARPQVGSEDVVQFFASTYYTSEKDPGCRYVMGTFGAFDGKFCADV